MMITHSSQQTQPKERKRTDEYFCFKYIDEPARSQHWREASIGPKPALARSQHWREASIGAKPALAQSQHWQKASIGMRPALA
jgi:hypothetical protein